jgi:membrane protein required for colicin V production
MTALDVLVLFIVGGAMVFGAMRGFVHELLALGAWVAAIAMLKLLHTPVTGLLESPMGNWPAAAVLAFILVFGLVFIAGKVVAHRVGGATRRSIVGPLDRVLGAGFGALKGLIGATLLYLAVNLVYDVWNGRTAARPAWIADSRTYPLLNASGRAIVDFVEWRRGGAEEEAAENSVGNDSPNGQ